MNKNTMETSRRTTLWFYFPFLALVIVLLHANTATEKSPITQASVNCAFLGADCARLLPGGKETSGLLYVNQAAKWNQYSKIIIDPVTFWGGDSTKVSAPDQQMLVNFFSAQLHEQLGKKFEIVQKPGPGVMKVSAAMTDAEAATTGLRSVSMIIPPAHLLSNLKYRATSSFPFVGSAQAEMKITDAVTGQTLAAAVDKQLGGGSMAAGFQWQWGDAENAIKDWSERLANQLSAWTSDAKFNNVYFGQ